MSWLENLLSPELTQAVGWTIVHSLWQGAVVGLALVGLLLVLRRHSAQVRYNVAGLALATMLGLALVTFGRHYALALSGQTAAAVAAAPAATTGSLQVAGTGVTTTTTTTAATTESATLLETGRQYFDQHLPLIVAAWFLGLLAMTLRLLGGLAYVQRLRHYRVEPLSEQWNERLQALADRAGLTRTVTLLESALVKAPLVAGHLKPVILLPLGTVLGLSVAQLEAILAHELAHIARRDYLLNILQSVAEILFFYHPAAWFITACLRTERENCCDDEATAICGDPLTLAKALAALAEMGQDVYPAPQLALSAVGPDGSLMGRIRRLVQRRAAPTFSEGFMAALVVIGGLALIGFTTVVSVAGPRPWPEKAKALVGVVFGPEDKVWSNSLPAFQATATPASAPAPASLAADDEDKKKRKAKDTNTVIVRDAAGGDGLRRGPDGGTVVVKRDKKGRITELYVDGQRIDMEQAKAKTKTKGTSTEVIRLAPESRTARTRTRVRTNPNFDFNFDFDGQNFGMSAEDQQKLDRSMRRLQIDLDKNQESIRRATRVYSSGGDNRVVVRSGTEELRIDEEKIAQKALKSAELSLRQAERTAPNEEVRAEIRQELSRIAERREELRERQEEARAEREEHSAEAREQMQQDREQAQLEREQAQMEREKARAERDKARAEREALRRKAEDAIIDELVKDKLIKDKTHFQLVLKADELTVDGQKQPAAVAAKYRKLFEEGTGRTLSASSTMVLSYAGGNTSRVYNSNSDSRSTNSGDEPLPPLPPAPPAAPRAPRAPRTPALPAVPAAPKAPREPKMSSAALGDQLRKDGLIGPEERSFQFQLNASGMTLNGRKQSAETAKRYRTLLGTTNGKTVNMNIVVTE